MSPSNPLWGAPRIHGELLKLGIEIGQTSLAKYMARHRKPPSRNLVVTITSGMGSLTSNTSGVSIAYRSSKAALTW